MAVPEISLSYIEVVTTIDINEVKKTFRICLGKSRDSQTRVTEDEFMSFREIAVDQIARHGNVLMLAEIERGHLHVVSARQEYPTGVTDVKTHFRDIANPRLADQ